MPTLQCSHCGSENFALVTPKSRRESQLQVRIIECQDCHGDVHVIDLRKMGDWHDQKRYPYRDIARKLIYDIES